MMKPFNTLIKRCALALAAGLAIPAIAQQQAIDTRDAARLSAVADSVSTYAGLAAGTAAEANPLVATSPAGLLALLAAKLGLISYTDTLPERQRLQAQRQMSSVWSGMSANNVALAVGAGPLAIPVGLLTGYLVYRSDAPQKLELAAPLPLGVRAGDGEAIGRMTLLAVRRADANGQPSSQAPLEHVVIADGGQAAKSDAVWRPDGSKYFVDQLLGEIPVTSQAQAHAVQRTVAERPMAAPSRTLTIDGWRHAYAVQKTKVDGSVDSSAPEVQITLDRKLQRDQKLIQYSDGNTYAVLRRIGVYPVAIEATQTAKASEACVQPDCDEQL